MEENQEPEEINEQIIGEDEEIITTDSNHESSINQWIELIKAVELALTITPVEDPEAERLERILETVNSYINSEFVDMDIPQVDKMKKKIDQFRNSVSSIVTKITKYSSVPFTSIQTSSSSE